MESTLERELNVPEIVANQAIGTSLQLEMCSRRWLACVFVIHGARVHPASGSTGLRSSADTWLCSEYATLDLQLRLPALGVPLRSYFWKGVEDIILRSVS